ncbi:MAG TPA: hypothetical protein VK705_03305 [Ferruginibacter sp.]|jgi:hypothetical protein|nr:hypothetical protein [Ferruginibacter sp.]
MKIKLFFPIFLLIFSCQVKAQQAKISIIVTPFSRDSIDIIIKNSIRDTVLFSLYKQEFIKTIWVTNVYDVFCDVRNPNTSILIINPTEVLHFRIHNDSTLYTDEKIKPGTLLQNKIENRIVLKGNKKDHDKMEYSFYSLPW